MDHSLTRTLVLVQAAQAGDRQALERLFSRYQDRVRRIVRLRLMGGSETRRLQIMAERQSDGDMVVED